MGCYNLSLQFGLCEGLIRMLRFSTAGESHGESLVAMVSGMPAGVTVEQEFIDRELWRRDRKSVV